MIQMNHDSKILQESAEFMLLDCREMKSCMLFLQDQINKTHQHSLDSHKNLEHTGHTHCPGSWESSYTDHSDHTRFLQPQPHRNGMLRRDIHHHMLSGDLFKIALHVPFLEQIKTSNYISKTINIFLTWWPSHPDILERSDIQVHNGHTGPPPLLDCKGSVHKHHIWHSLSLCSHKCMLQTNTEEVLLSE